MSNYSGRIRKADKFCQGKSFHYGKILGRPKFIFGANSARL